FSGEEESHGWLWSLQSGQLISDAPLNLKKWNENCAAQLSASGGRLLVTTPEKTVVLDTRDGSELNKEMPTLPVAILDPEGDLVAGASDPRTPMLWDVDRKKRQLWPESTVHTGPVKRLRFDSDGERLLVISDDTRA